MPAKPGSQQRGSLGETVSRRPNPATLRCNCAHKSNTEGVARRTCPEPNRHARLIAAPVSVCTGSKACKMHNGHVRRDVHLPPSVAGTWPFALPPVVPPGVLCEKIIHLGRVRGQPPEYEILVRGEGSFDVMNMRHIVPQLFNEGNVWDPHNVWVRAFVPCQRNDTLAPVTNCATLCDLWDNLRQITSDSGSPDSTLPTVNPPSPCGLFTCAIALGAQAEHRSRSRIGLVTCA